MHRAHLVSDGPHARGRGRPHDAAGGPALTPPAREPRGDGLPSRPLGRTGLAVTPLGLGTYCITQDWGTSRRQGLDVLHAAADLGVNLIDTAPLYGGGQAEELVGLALPAFRDGPVVVGKVGRFEQSIYRRRVDEAYLDADLIVGQFLHSLSLLRRDAVDVLVVHESDWQQWWPDGSVAGAPVMRALNALRDEGRTRSLGLSARDPVAARRLVATGAFDVLLYVHYLNVVWQEDAEDVLRDAHDAGMGVLVGAPYRRGMLLRAGEEDLRALTERRLPDVPPGIVERLRRAGTLASDAGMPLAELGLRYLLSDERVHAVLVGAESRAQLADNATWARRGALPPDVLAAARSLRDVDRGAWR